MFGRKRKQVKQAEQKTETQLIAEKIAPLSKIAQGELANCVEETAKIQLILPFLAAFGWDLTNPRHGSIETTVGAKKRADIMLLEKGVVKVVLEAKKPNSNLNNSIEQLKGYFDNCHASVGILTDGIEYWFFSSIKESPDSMDVTPFARVSIHTLNLEKNDAFLLSLCRDGFSAERLALFSDADRTRSLIYALLGSRMTAAQGKLIHDIFVAVYPSLLPNEIESLISFTKYHSRWNFRHGKSEC